MFQTIEKLLETRKIKANSPLESLRSFFSTDSMYLEEFDVKEMFLNVFEEYVNFNIKSKRHEGTMYPTQEFTIQTVSGYIVLNFNDDLRIELNFRFDQLRNTNTTNFSKYCGSENNAAFQNDAMCNK